MNQHGWSDRFSTYISDEPFCEDKNVIAALHFITGIYDSLPQSLQLPLFASTWRYCKQLASAITHWGAGQTGMFTLDEMRARRKAGEKLWFTTDGHLAIDAPFLANERLLPTYCFAYELSGYEYWGLSNWTTDPWITGSRPFTTYNFGPHADRVQENNGDGYLTYPGAIVGVDGLVPSIRLEAVRDGVDDYDYYRILEDLLAQIPVDDGRWDRGNAALDAARALVSIPNNGGLATYEIMPDPDAVYAVRQQVAAAILELLYGAPIYYDEDVTSE